MTEPEQAEHAELREQIGRAVSQYLCGTDDPDYQIADVVLRVVGPKLDGYLKKRDNIRDFAVALATEAERWRLRAERLEVFTRGVVLANGHTVGCKCQDAGCRLRRAALEEERDEWPGS